MFVLYVSIEQGRIEGLIEKGGYLASLRGRSWKVRGRWVDPQPSTNSALCLKLGCQWEPCGVTPCANLLALYPRVLLPEVRNSPWNQGGVLTPRYVEEHGEPKIILIMIHFSFIPFFGYSQNLEAGIFHI